ncbi:hypothetical protein EB231_23240 [Mesorhizobium sp. NZP2298]|nr:hypothetical protein EB231_23240 [Mesorhizobium sp. NZP2298]
MPNIINYELPADIAVITPAMIEAGIYSAREHMLGQQMRDLVVSVYLAMRLEQLNSEPRQP